MLTAIIPTLNRPVDLLKAVNSVCHQSKLPEELIIVDQSRDKLSLIAITKIIKKTPLIKLVYIHDPKIRGLVDAKRRAVLVAKGNLICFLEDDVILEPDYLKQIENGFNLKPDMIGCSGVITNPPKNSYVYKFLFVIFHRGIFKDKRIVVNRNFSRPDNDLIESDMLSGGLSAWRREVFDKIEFDILNDFHMFEDIDFSTRVANYFGNRLFINPNARLAHYFSPINRDVLDKKQRRKVKECFTYYKKRKDWPHAAISFYWLLLGMLLEAIFQSFSCFSFKPIQGYLLGFRDGYTKKIFS